MKKYLMNKNVEHNGKPYAKGKEIKESDEGFKAIVNAGHAEEFNFEEGDEEPSIAEPKQNFEVVGPQGEQGKQSAEQEKPARKPGK